MLSSYLSMALSSPLFKSYDIRGLVGSEIDVAFAEKLACALVDVIQPKCCVIGFDMRVSSPELAQALIRVFRAKRVDCVEIGLCTTPVFNNEMARYAEADLGVMITASHNPASYNGFKLCRKHAVPIGSGSGMEEICEAFVHNEQEYSSFIHAQTAQGVQALGRYEQKGDAREGYLTKVLALLPDGGASFQGVGQPTRKVVIDAGNGMAGSTLPALCARLPGLEVIPLYWELDGNFPNHEANPLNTRTLVDLQARVLAEGAIAGFAFDGDGDRIGVVDEKGQIVPGDALTSLLAQALLPTKPGSRVLYDLRCSWSTPEAIVAAGGVPEQCRVGHAHIKKQMRETGALFAGELSMHFYFSAFANCEASEYAMLLLLARLEKSGKQLSELWRPLQRYAHSGERNFHVTEPIEQVLKRLQETYEAKATSATRIDGLRYEFRSPALPETDWWMSVRASNTEPVIRLNVEARSREVMEARVREVEYGIIGAHGAAPSTNEAHLPS